MLSVNVQNTLSVDRPLTTAILGKASISASEKVTRFKPRPY